MFLRSSVAVADKVLPWGQVEGTRGESQSIKKRGFGKRYLIASRNVKVLEDRTHTAYGAPFGIIALWGS